MSIADRTTKIGGIGNRLSGDWWLPAIGLLGVVHLALFVTLQARPGAMAIGLWRWGPPALILATAALLTLVLLSALRTRQVWDRRRAAGLMGLCLLVASAGLYRTYPSSHDDAPSSVRFTLPLDGRIRVAWGGASARVNYHAGIPAERWGYDLLVTVDGVSHQGTGAAVADYHAYRQPVLAPASGRVVATHDGEPDSRPGRGDPASGGNFVVLEVAPAQFLFVAHLQAGTIVPAPGEWVRRGDLLGRVGNSGNSSEPHVHLHLQDTPEPGQGEGIPFFFSDYLLDDGTPDGHSVVRGMPSGGRRTGRWVGDVVRTR
jgi:murein DD-endopeptidase MepM/ murein hydrolase activator NlpD